MWSSRRRMLTAPDCSVRTLERLLMPAQPQLLMPAEAQRPMPARPEQLPMPAPEPARLPVLRQVQAAEDQRHRQLLQHALSAWRWRIRPKLSRITNPATWAQPDVLTGSPLPESGPTWSCGRISIPQLPKLIQLLQE